MTRKRKPKAKQVRVFKPARMTDHLWKEFGFTAARLAGTDATRFTHPDIDLSFTAYGGDGGYTHTVESIITQIIRHVAATERKRILGPLKEAMRDVY